MTRPRLKDGYTRIVHKLFEQLYLREINLKHLRVILLIMRMSYGTQKDYAIIKPKCRLGLAGLHKQDVKKIIEELIDIEIIKVVDTDTYKINKDFSTWKIPYSRVYDENQHAELVKLNLQGKQNTYQEVSETLTQNDKKVSKSLTSNNKKVSETLTSSKRNTYQEVSETLTRGFANHLLLHSENIDEEDNINPPKDNIKDKLKINNKDIIYYIKEENEKNGVQKNKKSDPYLNPIVGFFIEEYQKVFNQKPYILHNQLIKLTELSADIENFKETIPVVIEKLKSIDFDFPNFTANYIWLLKDDNYIKVLSGTFDKKKSELDKYYEERGLDEYGN